MQTHAWDEHAVPARADARADRADRPFFPICTLCNAFVTGRNVIRPRPVSFVPFYPLPVKRKSIGVDRRESRVSRASSYRSARGSFSGQRLRTPSSVRLSCQRMHVRPTGHCLGAMGIYAAASGYSCINRGGDGVCMWIAAAAATPSHQRLQRRY